MKGGAAALVHCVGSCTAWLSGLRVSLSSVQRAARSPRTCGAAGISAARCLCPGPGGVFLAGRRTQMLHCAPGKLAMEPRATGTLAG